MDWMEESFNSNTFRPEEKSTPANVVLAVMKDLDTSIKFTTKVKDSQAQVVVVSTQDPDPSYMQPATELKYVKEAVKHDQGKPDWSLLPLESLEEIVRVLEFGANKYAPGNWASNGGLSHRRVLSSLLRHIFAYMRGQDNDPETGLSHLAHAGCNIVFLLHYIRDKAQFNKDDRFKL